MKRILLIIYPLAVIASVTGALLGLAWMLLEKPLTQAASREEAAAASRVLTASGQMVKQEYLPASGSNGWAFYLSVGASGETQGYVFRSSRPGYGGEVECLTGITNGAVDRVLVLSAKGETPGLGQKAADAAWLSRLSGRTPEQLPLTRSAFRRTGLDAVSGATISSKAVTSAVFEAFRYYRKLVPLMVLTPQVTNRWGERITNWETNWTTELDAETGATEGGE